MIAPGTAQGVLARRSRLATVGEVAIIEFQ